MKLLRWMGILLVVLAGSRGYSGEETVETWIISGQSNASGLTSGRSLPANPLVESYDSKSRTWVPAHDTLPNAGSAPTVQIEVSAGTVPEERETAAPAGNRIENEQISSLFFTLIPETH